MLVEQIAVFLDNKVGALDKLISLLAENKINIESLNISENSDFGIVKIITDKNDEAITILNQNGYTAKSTQLIALEVEDKPGSLKKFLDMLSSKGIQIDYIYSHTLKTGTGQILFRTKDVELALKVLNECK